MILTIIWFKKCLKHNDKTFLVVIKKVQKAPDVVLEVLAPILDDFTKIISTKLLTRLPSNCKVVPSTKPPAMDPVEVIKKNS